MRVWFLEPVVRENEFAAGDDAGFVSKGRSGYEDRIHTCEHNSRKGPGGGDGAGCFGGVSRRERANAGRVITGRVSAGRTFPRGRGGRVAARNRAAGGRRSAEPRSSVGRAGHGFSAASVAGAAEDSSRHNADIYASGASARETALGTCSRTSLRDESGLHRGAMPPGGSHGRQPGGLSLGVGAQTEIARKRSSDVRLSRPQPCFSIFVPLGQSGLNLPSPSFRFFRTLV